MFKRLTQFIKAHWKLFIIFIVGILLGVLIVINLSSKTDNHELILQIREDTSGYSFIRPLLFAELGVKETFPEFKKLTGDLKKIVDTAVKENTIESASVYVRDMNTGHWTGAYEDQKYAPASMLKVALMIAYYKYKEEVDHTIFEKKVTFKKYPGTDQYYQPQRMLEAGKQYAIKEVIEQMIVHSGNNSNLILLENIPTKYIDKVYYDFRLEFPNEHGQFMSAQSYSAIFRALYNSTYLSRLHSEEALALLSKTTFTQGIAAGVPPYIISSHKFGERSEMIDGKAVHEVHDCGIIYYPQNPYFICVMTRGSDHSNLEKVISKLSWATYEEMRTIMQNRY